MKVAQQEVFHLKKWNFVKAFSAPDRLGVFFCPLDGLTQPVTFSSLQDVKSVQILDIKEREVGC